MLTRTNCSFVGMNYLGHAYLSYNHPEILVGNMVSDFVKGKARFGFSGKIQKGIELHRAIDAFTDSHPATHKAKEFFRPAYRLYSAPIIDVIFDHYLANDAKEFTDASLMQFSLNTYNILEDHASELPQNFLVAFTYMKTHNWLYHYKYEEGIRSSLKGLVRRSAFLTESNTAYNLFLENYVQLGECFQAFFGDVKQFAKQKLGAFV